MPFKVWQTKKDGFRYKIYPDYDAYVASQKGKLGRQRYGKWIKSHNAKIRIALRERMDIEWVKHGDSVLCLAARLGGEVMAFIDCGCFAVGIDLNPGNDNKFVLHGDFHKLQFANNSIDIVYTNSLDHSFDVESVTSEVKRVLKPSGLMILELLHGLDEGSNAGGYESFFWYEISDVIDFFVKSGFELVHSYEFQYPKQLTGRILRKVS